MFCNDDYHFENCKPFGKIKERSLLVLIMENLGTIETLNEIFKNLLFLRALYLAM